MDRCTGTRLLEGRCCTARPVSTLACSLLAIASWFAPLAAQPATATVGGRVLSYTSERPLDGARVSLEGTGLVTTTDPEGRFVLHAVPAGLQYFRVHYEDTRSDRLAVRVESGRKNEIEIFLAVDVVPLPPLAVSVRTVPSGKLAGFYRRMERATGVFITREQIERRDPLKTSDLFRTLPGIRVDRFEPGTSSLAIERGPGGCPIEYYLDGMRVRGFDVDAVPPQVIDGIEIYRGPAEVPPQFRRRLSCAAIVIWTRDPGR